VIREKGSDIIEATRRRARIDLSPYRNEGDRLPVGCEKGGIAAYFYDLIQMAGKRAAASGVIRSGPDEINIGSRTANL
jgi:hypothetical protein